MESLEKKTEEYARLAGTYAKEHTRECVTGSKGGDYRNVVTNIDIAISDLLKEKVIADFPNDHYYSEEEPTAFVEAARTWTIDPIDGTSNYARSIPFYSSCVSVVHNGAVLAAAVYNPVTDECFTLHEGEVRLNGTLVSVSTVATLQDAYVNFHPGRKAEHREWAGTLKKSLLQSVKKIMNLGSSALDLCYVAAGRTDVLIYGTLSTLDVAGAVAMVRAAGGEVYDYDTKKPIAYSEEPQRIIATANPTLLADFFDKIST